MPRKSTTLQLDLFSSSHDPGSAQPPRWQTLPKQTRQTLTSLIVRLLLDHVDDDPVAEPREMCDDL
ncbi:MULTISPECIES: hypothetical protein [unclassified Sphingomonas]|jgi:hypothetical protein|uniref:hypothetical protein n=1 Tax=unclassified Sphingomonas TaxID=196159 RepID=UPI0006FC7E19|nr:MULTISPECIES: hypothetical protein [unclassified Sphingomonas]KQX24238.1 hypothetical protein ASD17_25165 [Sphingomonas sp. Root1294]KQY69590.1 hypothetical protein ASD39_24870 [Sphingomonas sp. Root50]KRB87518.1 hypothetical protein ASE22_24400 [Sphingomonas sp. Root720]